MTKEEQQKQRGYSIALFIILLLLTIAFLVYLLLRPRSDAARTPTGNVDIFNININCSCGPDKKDDKKDDDEECDDDLTKIVSYSNSINNHRNTTVKDEGIVYVDDNNGWYEYQRYLKIFENVAFEYTSKIAPGVSNSYDFRVHNTTLQSIQYKVEFSEGSEYPINMLYRLRRNGDYLVGDADTWVHAADLASAFLNLSGNGTDNYTLDWEWPYEGGTDVADTEAGEKMASEYNLGIKITFGEA